MGEIRHAFINIDGLDTSPLSLPTEEAANNLMSEYFQATSLGMPFLHEPTFNQRLSTVYNMSHKIYLADTHTTTESRISLFFVLEVFAVALLTMQKHEPSKIPTWLADKYHKVAVQALLAAGLPNGVDGVQALLLIGQYHYLHPTLWVVWNTIGAAIRLAVELRLHQDPPPGQHDALALDIRRRTFWSAYAMDRNISIALGIPTCLSDGAINTAVRVVNPK